MSGLSNFLIDNNYHVLGDEGYTHSNILSPFRNPTTEQEREFNQLHYGVSITIFNSHKNIYLLTRLGQLLKQFSRK